MTHIKLRNRIISDARRLAREADRCEEPKKKHSRRVNTRMNSIYRIARREAKDFYNRPFNKLNISQQRHVIGKAHRLYKQGVRN